MEQSPAQGSAAKQKPYQRGRDPGQQDGAACKAEKAQGGKAEDQGGSHAVALIIIRCTHYTLFQGSFGPMGKRACALRAYSLNPASGAPFARKSQSCFKFRKAGVTRESAKGLRRPCLPVSRCARRQASPPGLNQEDSPCRPLSVGFAPLPPLRVGRTLPRPAALTGSYPAGRPPRRF